MSREHIAVALRDARKGVLLRVTTHHTASAGTKQLITMPPR
jgi:hypothetical protein